MTKRNILNLKTIIKDSTDVLSYSIIEIFSGDVRIDTGQTDFDGIDIFVISSGSIIDNKILIKIYIKFNLKMLQKYKADTSSRLQEQKIRKPHTWHKFVQNKFQIS